MRNECLRLINKNDWGLYKRTNIAEMRPVTEEEIKDGLFGNIISLSQADLENGSPKAGDMIARNPNNFNDQWLVAKEYFQNNFEEIYVDDITVTMTKDRYGAWMNFSMQNEYR